MKKKRLEILTITELESTALLMLLIPESQMNAAEDSEEKVIESILEELIGEKDLHTFVTRKRGKRLRKKISVGPMEKEVLLKIVSEKLKEPNLREWYRKELGDIDRRLEKI